MKKKPTQIEILKHREGPEYFDELETSIKTDVYALDDLANGIGWIIINFNSLEDSVTESLKESFSDRPTMDEKILLLIQSMSFSQKVGAFFQQHSLTVHYFDQPTVDKLLPKLKKVTDALRECARGRNGYVHADWMGISKKKYVLIKAKFKDTGLFHTYRKFNQGEINKDIKFIHKAMDLVSRFEGALEDQRHFYERRIEKNWRRIRKSDKLKVANEKNEPRKIPEN